MSARQPSPFPSRVPTPRPFPTRGVPGGWRDAWDDDPIEAVLAALPSHSAHQRHIVEAGQDIELRSQVREDGRWEAHITSWSSPNLATRATGVTTSWRAAAWPSVNGPTAAVALDALEAELRDLIRDTGAFGAVTEEPVATLS